MAESISACSLECKNSEVHKCKKTSTKYVVGILLDKAYVTKWYLSDHLCRSINPLPRYACARHQLPGYYRS